MKTEITEILEKCIQAIEKGDLSLEECLVQYPQHAQELAELLNIRQEFVSLSPVKPSQHFRKNAFIRIQNTISAENKTKKPSQAAINRRTPMRSRKFARVGITLVLLFVLFVSSTTGVALASNNALPGDPLYFVDTTIEGIQLALADDEGDVELLNQFANERVAEIQALIEAGRQEDIPAAVQSFQNTNQQLGEAIGNLDPDARGEQILARIAEAHQTRTETLNGLLNQVPEQAQQGIQNALEAGPPDHVGGPNTDNNGNGPPEDRGGGQPEDVGGGKPEGVGGGPPEGKGNPNNQPGCNENRPDDPGAQGNGAADEHGNNENQGNGPPDCEGEGQEPTDTVGDE